MPMYCYRCADCGRGGSEMRAMKDRGHGPPCRCGARMQRDITAETGAVNTEYAKPIEMMSLAVDTVEEVHAFRTRNPDIEISDRPGDRNFGIPVVKSRQQKLSVLHREEFIETN